MGADLRTERTAASKAADTDAAQNIKQRVQEEMHRLHREMRRSRMEVDLSAETEASDGASVEARLRFGHWAATSAELESAQREQLQRQLAAVDRENKILQKRLEGRADIVKRAVEDHMGTSP